LEEQSVGIPPIERKVLKFSDVNETTKTNWYHDKHKNKNK
jgi:hypothetical protein